MYASPLQNLKTNHASLLAEKCSLTLAIRDPLHHTTIKIIIHYSATAPVALKLTITMIALIAKSRRIFVYPYSRMATFSCHSVSARRHLDSRIGSNSASGPDVYFFIRSGGLSTPQELLGSLDAQVLFHYSCRWNMIDSSLACNTFAAEKGCPPLKFG